MEAVLVANFKSLQSKEKMFVLSLDIDHNLFTFVLFYFLLSFRVGFLETGLILGLLLFRSINLVKAIGWYDFVKG
jgi:uncharacterized membrane protein (DUF485 family)